MFKNPELGRKLFLASHPSLAYSQTIREVMTEGDRTSLIILRLIVSEGKYNEEAWNRSLYCTLSVSCQLIYHKTKTPCLDLPDGEEMKVCGKVSRVLLLHISAHSLTLLLSSSRSASSFDTALKVRPLYLSAISSSFLIVVLARAKLNSSERVSFLSFSDHQRADWKIHKIVCFPIAWEV